MKNRFTGRLGGLFGNDVARGYLRGFTLIELLVVVLIIGILSAIALPQYQMAVTKSRVATMLPLMRRWYDAMAMYKIENGYYSEGFSRPGSAELGVSWPSDWTCSEGWAGLECWNEQWYCMVNEEMLGEVYCRMEWLENEPLVQMSQPDDPYYPPGKRFCLDNEKVCKALGGKEIPGYSGYYEF